MTTVRWGILGCGDVTEVKSGPAYQQVEGFSLDAVMARTEGKAEDFARRHGVPKFYTDAQALIDDPQLDAIYIATPPDSHFEYALAVAQAGKICSVEKPMALDFAQCRDMIAAFEQADKPLFVAYYRRSLPQFATLKTWIAQQRIGAVRHVSWQYTRPPKPQDFDSAPDWRTQADIAPGGYFDDIACHGLDILMYLVGNISSVGGHSLNQQGLYSSADAISASWVHDNGATGTGSWNFGSFAKHDRVEIHGDKGLLRFGIFTEAPAELITATGTDSLPMPKPTPIQGHYVQDMADHLAGRKVHPSLAEQAAETSRVMDAILNSYQRR